MFNRVPLSLRSGSLPRLRGEGNALPERNRQSMMLHQSTINI